MTTLRLSNEIEEKFMDYLIKYEYGEFPVDFFSEARALFLTIQRSFNGSGFGVFVNTDPYLVNNLVDWVLVTMKSDGGETVPWYSVLLDDILGKTLRGFMRTLAEIIRDRGIEQGKHGKWLINGFIVPDWFAERVLSKKLSGKNFLM